MATLAKAYNVTHFDGLIIEASSYRRPFDDLYDELNGRLDSANIATSLAFVASQIDISANTYFSATELNSVLKEAVPRGFHDVHFFAYERKLSVFPGKVENDGRLLFVKQRINLSLTNAVFITGSLTPGNIVGVGFAPVADVTASNIRFANITAISTTGNKNFGVYDSSGSQRNRLVYTFKWTSQCQAIDWEFITPPVTGQTYKLANSEAQAHSLFSTGYASATSIGSDTSGGRVTAITRYCNLSTQRYEWELAGRFATATANLLVLVDNLSADFSAGTVLFEGGITIANTNLGFTGHIRDIQGGLLGEIQQETSEITLISRLTVQASNTIDAPRFFMNLSWNMNKNLVFTDE